MQKPSFYSRYGFSIILLAVFVLPIVLLGARTAMRSNSNDVREWLPKEYGETAQYAWFQSHFGNEEFVVVSWPGCQAEDDRLALLEAKLRVASEAETPGHPKLIRRVITGRSLIEELGKTPLNLTPEEVKSRFEGTLFGPEGQQTCAVVILTDAAKRHLKPTIATIRNLAIDECGIRADELKMGGPPVVNAAIDTASARSLMQLAALSGIVGLVIAYWCFRTVRLTMLVFLAGVYSAAASLAVVSISGWSMNAILMTMAPLVYVAATSGAIHLSNYYRDAVQEKGPQGAAGRAIRHAWVPLGLATSTTAIGLLSLLYSELQPIEAFGLFSAIGVVISLFMLFLVLPSVLEIWPPKEARREGTGEHHETGEMPLSPRWRRFAETVIANHVAVSVTAFALLAVCTFGLLRVETSIKIMRFFDPDTEIIHTYRWLESNLGSLVPMEVVLRLDDETCPLNTLERIELVQEVQRKIESVHDVGSTTSAATFTKDLPARTGWPYVGWNRERGPTARTLARKLDRFEETNYFARGDGEQLWRISLRVGALNDVDYGTFIHELERAVRPTLELQQAAIRAKKQEQIDETEQRLKELEEQAQELAVGNRPPRIAVQPVAFNQEEPLSVAQQLAALRTEQADLEQKLKQLTETGVDAAFTGMVPVVYKAQRSLLDGLLFGFTTDLALIVLAIMLLMRHWSSGILLLCTSVFPTTVVFGLMGWLGIVIDVGTVMTPSVALGVTIDDVVHFILWFKKGIEQGLNRRQAVMLAYEGCARAMYQSWGVIGLGLSMFAFASFTPTQRFGALMVTLLTAGLVGNLFFLPALLTGPLGGIVERAVLARQEKKRRQKPAEPVRQRLSELSPTAELLVRPERRSVKT